MVYYGTSNPGPWDSDARPGDNKFTAGIFARDIDTGEAVWFYQFSPHDLYDYDAVNENILLELPINGHTHKVLVHPDRNGYVYVLDRTNGQVLSASAYAPITTTRGVNLNTGLLEYVEEKKPTRGKAVRGLCPASPGAKDWQRSAISAKTGLLYIPHQRLCMDEEHVSVNYIAGTPYVGANVVMYFAPGGESHSSGRAKVDQRSPGRARITRKESVVSSSQSRSDNQSGRIRSEQASSTP